MNHDDDALDRMLAALPLEEPPTTLYGRIMAATVYAPPVAAASFPVWELWLVGLFAALAVWLSWTVVATPHLSERVSSELTQALASGFSSPETLLWLAAGTALAWSVTFFRLPTRRIQA